MVLGLFAGAMAGFETGLVGSLEELCFCVVDVGLMFSKEDNLLVCFVGCFLIIGGGAAFSCVGTTLSLSCCFPWHFTSVMVGSGTFFFIWKGLICSLVACGFSTDSTAIFFDSEGFFCTEGTEMTVFFFDSEGFCTDSTAFFFDSEGFNRDCMEGSGASWSLSPLDKTIRCSLLP